MTPRDRENRQAAPWKRVLTAMQREPYPLHLGVVLLTISVGTALYYIWSESQSAAGPGFPLDDAWIHLRIARNIAEGRGFSFNPGVPTAGATAPLWSLLLAIPAALGMPAVAGAQAMGVLWGVIAALAAAALAWEASKSSLAAWAAGCAVALSPRVTWGAVSGMEVTLYAALVPIALWSYLREWPRGGHTWAVWAALAGTARPEAFVLLPVMFGHQVATDVGGWRGRRRHLRAVGLALVVIVPYAALNWRGGGTPLPTTFYAKSYGAGLLNGLLEGNAGEVVKGVTSHPLSTLNTLLLFSQGQSAIFFMGWLAGMLALLGLAFRGVASSRGAAVIALMFLAAPLATGAVAPVPPILVHDGRYIGHLVVLFFVIGSCGFAALNRVSAVRWVMPALAGLALLRLLSQDVKAVDRYVAMTGNIQAMNVTAARWFEAHTREDATIATNDVGAIGYLADRFIIDTEGLVTPAIVPFKRQHRLLAYLERAKPDLLAIFPEWYPELAGRPDLFAEIHRVTALPRVVSGGPTLVIYRTPWTRAGVLKGLQAVAAYRDWSRSR